MVVPDARSSSEAGGSCRPGVGRASRLTAWACAGLLVGALAAGCGSDSDEVDTVEGPLPSGPEDARAYTEEFLARNPRAQVQPGHLVITRLEPARTTERDTCSEAEGVDCIPYFFEQDIHVELSADEGTDYLAEVVLVDASGVPLLRARPGGESATALVPAGDYRLELRHASSGDAEAPTQTIFLRPAADAPEDDAALAAAGAGGSALPPKQTIQAGRDCIRCNFAKAELINQNFDGAMLTGSVFDEAKLRQATFRGATMDGCSLLGLRVPVFEQREFDGDFSGATLSGAHFSFRSLCYALESFVGIFRGATLDGSTWDPTPGDAPCLNLSFLLPDFRGANLRGSRMTSVRLDKRPNQEGRCTFQGADLSGADLSEPDADLFSRRRGTFGRCDFSRDPDSGKITTLAGADLSRASFIGANLVEADLSGAVLRGTFFRNPTAQGTDTDLSKANLTGATIEGTNIFWGVNLSGVTLAAIKPPTLNGLNLAGTKLSGVDLAGLDLSQTDLSKAVLFGGSGAARFVGAKLSNGTRGVNLTGQKFPPRFGDFKDSDLTGAVLTSVELLEGDLERVVLNNAQLVGADLNFANLHAAKLRGATLGVEPGREGAAASLRGAFMTDIDLTDADLRSVDLNDAHLYGDAAQTLLERTRLDSAVLAGAICSGARFSGTLNDTVFIGAQLVNTVFNGARLNGTKFNDAYLQGADFSNAIDGTGVSLSNAAIAAQAGTWSFTEQDGTPFTVRYEATKLGPLADNASVRCPDGSLGPCCPSRDLAACLNDKLKPVRNGPFPPVPECVPKPPRYDNCITPMPTATRRPTPTATPRPG